MKKFIQFLLVPALFFLPLLTPTSVSAVSCDDNAIFGLVPWNCNADPSSVTDTNSLSNTIWTIVANVATDLTVIAAYLVLGFVIYGGYLYIFAAGDPGKVAAGKKTLSQAFIGLAIVLSANVILGTIRVVLGANFSANCATLTGSPPSGCLNISDSGNMVTHIIQWVVGVAGLVALIFVVYGAVAYITSAGDAGRAAKAKNVITYSLIGLAIVALAEIGTAFVSNLIKQSINGSGSTSSSNTVYLAASTPDLPSLINSNLASITHERNLHV